MIKRARQHSAAQLPLREFERNQLIVKREMYAVLQNVKFAQHEINDLTSYAWIGLYEARKRFEPTRGLSFSTYARIRVRGAIFDGLAELSLMGRRGLKFIKRAQHNMQSSLAGSEAEWCSLSTLRSAYQLKEHVAQFLTMGIHDWESSPESITQQHEELIEYQARLSEAFDQLSPDEQRLIVAAYDLREVGDCATRHADRMGVHRSTIARRQAMVLDKMRRSVFEISA